MLYTYVALNYVLNNIYGEFGISLRLLVVPILIQYVKMVYNCIQTFITVTTDPSLLQVDLACLRAFVFPYKPVF